MCFKWKWCWNRVEQWETKINLTGHCGSFFCGQSNFEQALTLCSSPLSDLYLVGWHSVWMEALNTMECATTMTGQVKPKAVQHWLFWWLGCHFLQLPCFPLMFRFVLTHTSFIFKQVSMVSWHLWGSNLEKEGFRPLPWPLPVDISVERGGRVPGILGKNLSLHENPLFFLPKNLSTPIEFVAHFTFLTHIFPTRASQLKSSCF